MTLITNWNINHILVTLVKADDQCHPLLDKIDKQTTLISELKTIYIYQNQPWSNDDLKAVITQLVHNYLYNLTIDINSFANNDIHTILPVVVETIQYVTYPLWNQKTDQVTQLTYDILINDHQAKDVLIQTSFEKILITMEAVNQARNYQIMAPNYLHAPAFQNYLIKQLGQWSSLKIKLFTKLDLQLLNMNLLLAVNQASQYDPCFMVIEYQGNLESHEKLVLVGKGITFDTGGICLKPSPSQIDMKFDMSGAAIVTSVIEAIARLQLKINISVIVCITDNVIGSRAVLTEAVIKSFNGKTVEINNTDAEGRLVLADGVSYAKQHLVATEIISVATLTGAIITALGTKTTGVFTNDQSLMPIFHNAAQQAHELIWQMPLLPWHSAALKNSPVADLTNVAYFPNKNHPDFFQGASASTGAAFINEFVDQTPFIHIDIGGTAYVSAHTPTGVMVKTLINYGILKQIKTT